MLRRISVLVVLVLIGAYAWVTFFSPTHNKLLAHVPADTPYLIAQLKPLPKPLSDKLMAYYAVSYKRAVENLRKADQTDSASAAHLKPLLSVLELFEGKMSKDGLASIGLKFNGTGLVYGIGLFPVLRAEIANAAKFNTFIDQLEAQLKVSDTKEQFEGRQYRLIDLDKLVVLIGTHNTELTVAALPKAVYKDYLAQLFGKQDPQHNLGNSRLVHELAEKFGLKSGNIGFVDFKRVFEQFNDPDSTTRKLMSAAGAPAPQPLPQGCDKVADYFLDNVPRTVFGATKATGSELAVSYFIETSDAVATGLKQLSVPVPGLGQHQNALAEIGMGIDLNELRRGLVAATEGLIAQANGCALVNVEQLRAAVPKISLALNPMVTGIKGFNLVLDKLNVADGATEPDIQATLVAAVDEPMPLLSLAGAFNPALANLQIKEDGKPVQVPAAKAAPGLPPIYLAVEKHALGIGVGEQTKAQLEARLTEAANPAEPFLSLAYRPGELLAAIGPTIQANLQMAKPKQQQAIKDTLDNLRTNADLASWMAFTIKPVKHGLALDYTVKLK